MINKIVLLGMCIAMMHMHGFAQEKKQRPNIVFILADDLGYGDIGSYGQQLIETPNLDRLAEQGMRFTQFYAGATVCAPSRSSLMSGQHTGHTFIRGNKEIEPEGQYPLADSVQTFAQLLQQAGYRTGAFGKWGLGMVGTTGAPDRKGFDRFFGYNCQRQSHRYYPTHLWDNDRRVVLEGNDLNDKVVYAPELIQQEALRFIDEHADTPFFLFIPTVLPHAELQGPADEHYLRYRGQFEEQPHRGNDYGPDATVPGYASVEDPRATFAGMVARLDAYVGEVIDKLEERGLADHTIVVFSSDNGPHREGGADPDFFNSGGGLRGYKRDLYEGGIRVPFLVSWPGVVQAGSVSHWTGAFWDIMPTVADIIGVERPRQTDGISFLPTLVGDHNAQESHPYLYWEFHEAGGRQAVRVGDWKLVRLDAKSEAPIHELYNLDADPSESTNVAEKHPKVMNQLISQMDRIRVESAIFPFVPDQKTPH